MMIDPSTKIQELIQIVARDLGVYSEKLILIFGGSILNKFLNNTLS
jgi:hypothetical protein